MKEELISAFAFKTGKEIEKIIVDTTNNLQDKNTRLEATILHWYMSKGKDPEFAKFFNIVPEIR
jgi:hypothetical protein